MIGFLIALLSGALMSIQGVFNTQVTKTTGMWVGNGWVQFTAFCGLSCDVVFYRKRSGFTAYGSTAEIYAVRRCDRRRDHMDGYKKYRSVRPARSALLIVIAQLTVAYLIQLFGLFGMDREPFSWRKSRWSPYCGCRHSSFSMEIKVINL